MIQSKGGWFIGEKEYECGGLVGRKTINEQELSLKNQRVEFWEKHHSIPAASDIICWGLEAEK